MTRYLEVQQALQNAPKRWLVTGVAGFIGSHLAETLLRLDQEVVGLDNFATGYKRNLTDITNRVGPEAAQRFRFLEGDIRDPRTCAAAAAGVDFVLHQAALGSVPRSMEDPLSSHTSNVDGFVNMLLAAHGAGVKRVVYASSSSVYGDEAAQPKVEERIGRPLSPYATTKLVDEIYADTLRRTHGIESVGLRYFNVFGPRQDPQGAYAAVIPRWTQQLISGEPCLVFGDGSTSRDFCYVENVVQANLLAATAPSSDVAIGVFNIACGASTTLLELFDGIRRLVGAARPAAVGATLRVELPRPGDIPHSLASIDRARALLGYKPMYDVTQGLQQTINWYLGQAAARAGTGTTAAFSPAQEAS
jgi:UDP-N-acetylglucosamine/UDP-N-acetylgalactosamine 4-epimerase